MWSNDKLLHIADMEQFVIAPHDEIASHDNQLCHVLQNCLSCGAIFIHMTSKITLQQQKLLHGQCLRQISCMVFPPFINFDLDNPHVHCAGWGMKESIFNQ